VHDTQNAIRFSLGAGTTNADVTQVVATVVAAVARLRRVAEGRGRTGKGRCG
jgi:cysteine sulfinate desulfinase/cysteine desulfurase-like protein